MNNDIIDNVNTIDQYDIVKIEWIDTISDNSGWNETKSYDFASHEEQSLYETVGFFVNSTDLSVFVCMSANIDSDITGNMLSIPKTSIVSIKRLVENY
jgi:hypothetical protein